jgi:hypothetical protein
LATRVGTLESNYTNTIVPTLNSKVTISEVNSAISGAGFASASSVATLSSTVGQHTTDITTNQSSINGLQGKYGVTINNNGAISGFQINSGASGASNFIVQADTFKIKTSSGTLTPFSVSGDTVTLSNVNVSGNFALGSSPAVSGTSMSGSGSALNSNGTFALGNATTNISYNGSQMTLNGNVVAIGNLLPGAALPNYVRTYKGSVSPNVNIGDLASNRYWGPLAMDASSLNNKLGATDYDSYRTLFQPGTYFYELSVPVKNNTSDTNDATYTALVENPPGGVGSSYQDVEVGYDYDNMTPIYQSQLVSNPYTVISTAGVNVVGDWQTATIFGVGRFTISTPTYISPAVMTTESNNMNVVARSGYCTLIWRVWKAD